MASASQNCLIVVPAGRAGTPAVWVSTWRTVVASLPCAANSGQSSATGVS
jgi:hypothetical protein